MRLVWTSLFASLLLLPEAARAEDEAEEKEAVTEEASEAEEEDDEFGDDATANALGAANPVVASNTGKPWQVSAVFSTSMGSSTFANNSDLQLAYSISATGLYRIAPLFEGRLDALVRVLADQVIDEGPVPPLGATDANQFFFRDVRIGVLGRGLYKWKETGITFGANTTIDLPTSEAAQFAGRILRWNTGVNAADMISKVGPGNLLLTAGFTFRKDVAEINPSIEPVTEEGRILSQCRQNSGSAGRCFTQAGTLDFALIYGGSARYFLGDFSLGLGATFFNAFFYVLNDSDLPEGGLVAGNVEVGQGVAVQDAPNHTMLLSLSADVTYVINKYFNTSFGITSFQVPIRMIDQNPRTVVSPFFDSPENNETSLFLSFSAMY